MTGDTRNPSRTSERHPVLLFALISLPDSDQWHAANIINISATGAFVKTTEVKPQSDSVIKIRVPQLAGRDSEPILARVRHTLAEEDIFLRGLSSGVGIEFESVPDDIQTYLNIYIDSFTTSEPDPSLENEIHDIILQARRAEVLGLLKLADTAKMDDVLSAFQAWEKRFRPNRFVGRVDRDHLYAIHRLHTRIANYVEWILKGEYPELEPDVTEEGEATMAGDGAVPLTEISRILTASPLGGPALSFTVSSTRRNIAPIPASFPDQTWSSQDEMVDYVRRLDPHLHAMEFFELLGISRSAHLGEIEEAYFWRIRQFHPDRYPEVGHENHNRLLRIVEKLNEAFITLRDPKRRRQYHADLEAGAS